MLPHADRLNPHRPFRGLRNYRADLGTMIFFVGIRSHTELTRFMKQTLEAPGNVTGTRQNHHAIVGVSSAMLERYSQISMVGKRKAVEALKDRLACIILIHLVGPVGFEPTTKGL